MPFLRQDRPELQRASGQARFAGRDLSYSAAALRHTPFLPLRPGRNLRTEQKESSDRHTTQGPKGGQGQHHFRMFAPSTHTVSGSTSLPENEDMGLIPLRIGLGFGEMGIRVF